MSLSLRRYTIGNRRFQKYLYAKTLGTANFGAKEVAVPLCTFEINEYSYTPASAFASRNPRSMCFSFHYH